MIISILSKIKTANISGVSLVDCSKVPTVQYNGGSTTTAFSPSFYLTEPLKSLNGKKVSIFFNISNTKEKALEQIKNRNGTFLEGFLEVKHKQVNTDLDSWFESSMELKTASGKVINFNNYLEKCENKFLFIEVLVRK